MVPFCEALPARSPRAASGRATLFVAAAFLTGAVATSSFSAAAAATEPPATISIGPNVLVSRDGDVPHMETIIAANPVDAKNLIGASITSTRPEGAFACRTYSSQDRGTTWTMSEFPEQVRYGGADPWLVFTPSGTALFVALAMGSMTDADGRARGGVHVYRSTDGGRTWPTQTDICCSHDHEQLAVDLTLGPYAGRVYMATLHGYPVYRIGVFRSTDDGRSFIGPVNAADGGGEIGVNVVDIQVLGDGTLVVPYIDFEFKPEKRVNTGRNHMNVWFVYSTDGGVTFSKPSRGHYMESDLDDPDNRRTGGFLSLGSDSTGGKHNNRLYMVWKDMRFGKPRILISHSDDRGIKWSEPKQIDSSVPAASLQFMPEVAVNKDGVVGVLWLDTRDSQDTDLYHAYFSASLDGGDTFLAPQRVSSAPSHTFGPGNVRPSAASFVNDGKVILSLISAASRWPAGGDYIGLTGDLKGSFWPLWPDARTGTFQLYTTEIEVVLPKPAAAAAAAAPPPVDPDEAPAAGERGERDDERIEISLVDKVELVFDPTVYDGTSKVVELPVHLKNVSNRTIYPPIRIKLLAFGGGFEGAADMALYKFPEVENADNGERGAGAVWSFDGALGNRGELAPGAQTGSVAIRLRLTDPLLTPPMRFEIEGEVEDR